MKDAKVINVSDEKFFVSLFVNIQLTVFSEGNADQPLERIGFIIFIVGTGKSRNKAGKY